MARRATCSASKWGDWAQPLFRYVESGDGESEGGSGEATGPVVIAETLACLDRARPPDGFDTPRVLDEDTYRGAFDAWEIARTDIVKRWNFLADKANLEPKVPPALRRAAEILRAHPPAGLTQDKTDRTIDAICAPLPRAHHPDLPGRHGRDRGPPPSRPPTCLGSVRSLGLEPYTHPSHCRRSHPTTSTSSAGWRSSERRPRHEHVRLDDTPVASTADSRRQTRDRGFEVPQPACRLRPARSSRRRTLSGSNR